MNYSQRNLQATINKISAWCETAGLQISTDKTSSILFSRRRGDECPSLHLGSHPIPCSEQVRFLGLTFDKRLSWVPHVSELRRRCTERLKLLKVLSSTTWGADRFSLKMVYQALICSKIDYGSFIYGSAKTPVLGLVDSIHFNGIRSISGAFRTTPVLSLCAEAGLSPLIFRRHQLAAKYITKVYTIPNHPCYPYIFSPKHVSLFLSNPSSSLPFPLRVSSITSELKQSTMPRFSSHTPPWKFVRPSSYCIADRKDQQSELELKCRLAELLHKITDRRVFFTDGSHTGTSSACAFVDGEQATRFKLNPKSSIFSAEMFAISAALHQAMLIPESNVVVYTDSKSAVTSTCQMYSDNPGLVKLLHYATMLGEVGKTVHLVWVPGHRGISGNEAADRAAVSAHELPDLTAIPLTSTELTAPLLRTIKNRWREMWEESGACKLKMVKTDLTYWESSSRSSRKEEVLLARLRLGHTRLTHSYIMSGGRQPMCSRCKRPLSVQHIIEECRSHSKVLRKLNIPRCVAEALCNTKAAADKIIQFLRLSGLENLI